MKEIIYTQLSKEIDCGEKLSYLFTSYEPILTYKGKCELDYKKTGFDSNIYNILASANNNNNISDIILNTYLSMEEVANYLLFLISEGYFEQPDNPRILNIIEFIAGKTRTGEYFKTTGKISEAQLETIIQSSKQNPSNKKFGQLLVESGLITNTELNTILSIKEESKKRFILDYNEVPISNQCYSKESDKYQKEIEELKNENTQLKNKLENLLTVVKN